MMFTQTTNWILTQRKNWNKSTNCTVKSQGRKKVMKSAFNLCEENKKTNGLCERQDLIRRSLYRGHHHAPSLTSINRGSVSEVTCSS